MEQTTKEERNLNTFSVMTGYSRVGVSGLSLPPKVYLSQGAWDLSVENDKTDMNVFIETMKESGYDVQRIQVMNSTSTHSRLVMLPKNIPGEDNRFLGGFNIVERTGGWLAVDPNNGQNLGGVEETNVLSDDSQANITDKSISLEVLKD